MERDLRIDDSVVIPGQELRHGAASANLKVAPHWVATLRVRAEKQTSNITARVYEDTLSSVYLTYFQ